ncbi:MAG: sigma-70 family RNA polymerase sigma factor [Peptococcaceae bacterium]|nr:sigma-70 family RNA polymerase sigma factor [Peptococcaceae bacterium]
MKQDLEELVVQYKNQPTEEKLNELLLSMEPLIKYWVQTQCYLQWEKEDMLQVARIAVVGALERFEPEKGIRFKTFAYRTVSGKLMNYYRDHTWQLSIPRKYRELSGKISRAEGEFVQQYGKTPSTEQLANLLGSTSEEIVQALEAKQAIYMTSLSEPLDDENGSERLNLFGAEDKDLASIETKGELKAALETLSDNERKVIYYRYFEDMTQSKVAELLGISQMQVSRLEKNALQQMRKIVK